MARRKKNVPKDETKRDKFKRIVEPRVRKAIKAIGLIGNCASGGYEYTTDDVALILVALDKAFQQLRKQYESKGVQDIEFDLD
ncbi:hypothetical protein ES707_09377 [subsurface metagenome]